jgi:hypothetical protein
MSTIHHSIVKRGTNKHTILKFQKTSCIQTYSGIHINEVDYMMRQIILLSSLGHRKEQTYIFKYRKFST